MIEELITLIIAIKQIGFYTILLSYKTGQIIVFGIQTALDVITSICSTLWTGLVIIAEDFAVFALDLSSAIGRVVLWFFNCVDHTANTLLESIYLFQSGIQNITNCVASVYNGIIHIITRVILFTTNILSWIKGFFILFGQGVWFAVSIIPLSIAYLCISTTYFIGRVFEEGKNVVYAICENVCDIFNNIYQFVTDVPAESLAGLMIAVCLTYVLIKCHIILFKFLRNTMINLVSKCRHRFSFTFRSESDNIVKNGSCVICFERSKCLLTMPCRHLCMCAECWEQLQNYQVDAQSKSCPVCRKTVQYTIQVY